MKNKKGDINISLEFIIHLFLAFIMLGVLAWAVINFLDIIEKKPEASCLNDKLWDNERGLKDLLKEVDKPLFSDFWERLNQSLDYLSQKKERTCVRLTVIKGINDIMLDKYAEMIMKGDPDFIEVKSYMHVGPSRENLNKDNMPLHEEIVIFSKKLVQYLPGYEIVSEHVPSRVVMFAKKEYQKNGIWQTWIDFPKWHQLVNSGQEFAAADYSIRTPRVGLSGKGTLMSMPSEVRERFLKQHPEMHVFVNESMQELSFYEE